MFRLRKLLTQVFFFSPPSLAITIAPVIFGISHQLICHISHPTVHVTKASFFFSPPSLAITIAPVIFGISHQLICHISHSTVHVIDTIHLHSNFVICKRLGQTGKPHNIGQTFSFCPAVMSVCLSSSFNSAINRLGLGSD